MTETLHSDREYYDQSFTQLDAVELELSDTLFDGCQFDGCDFSRAQFSRCTFRDCEFIDCNLSVVQLGFSKFMDVVFSRCKLIGIDWTRAAWPRHQFSAPVRCFQSLLNDSSFYGLQLSELVAEDCALHGVDFRDGNFTEGNFRGSDFTGALFANTNLTSADFSDAVEYDIDLLNNRLKGAKFSRFEALRLLQSLEIELLD